MFNYKNKYCIACFLALGLAAIVLVNACKKEPEPLPPNPYDDVDYGTEEDEDSLVPGSFPYIQEKIFTTECALPGCHDGHFEPDFRTIQSSYSTLVYHSIIKNSPDSSFTFRVVPFNKEESVLYERITNCCFVNQDDRMPQDAIGVPLPQSQIDMIGDWIDNGAKDPFGNVATYPNSEPRTLFYIPLDLTYTINYGEATNRVDSIEYNPFYIPQSTDFYIAVFVEDDSTAINDLTVNQLKISNQQDDFSGAQTVNGTYVQSGNDEFYLFQVSSSNFTVGETNYMRYYTNDGDNPTTEYPLNETFYAYKTYWAFIVEP